MSPTRPQPPHARPTLSPVGREALAACVALVRAEPDAWARAWRDAPYLLRTGLLSLSGLPENLADTHQRWDAFTDTQRWHIKQTARTLHAWLGRVLADTTRSNVQKSQTNN